MAVEQETTQPEALVEEEPRYLRRQKPLEVRRRKFGRRSWSFYRRMLVGSAAMLVGGWILYEVGHFLLYSPRVLLSDFGQIELRGNHYVGRTAVFEKFAGDRGRSVVRVPLGARRRAIEAIPWAERASVERILPNRIRVDLTERTPVAFLRMGSELALIDAYGVILERPLDGNFRFPVVTGISPGTPRADRQQRMQLYVEFLKEIELARAGASDQISEVGLSDGQDVRATVSGWAKLGAQGAADQGPVLVLFGDTDFVNKFCLLVDNIGPWRASAGRVDSIDLRFARQVVVNPETRTDAARQLAPREGTSKHR